MGKLQINYSADFATCTEPFRRRGLRAILLQSAVSHASEEVQNIRRMFFIYAREAPL